MLINFYLLILGKRLLVYMKLSQRNKSLPATPPGYTDFNDDMQQFAIAFKRLTGYNYTVFGEHFHEILNKKVINQNAIPQSTPELNVD